MNAANASTHPTSDATAIRQMRAVLARPGGRAIPHGAAFRLAYRRGNLTLGAGEVPMAAGEALLAEGAAVWRRLDGQGVLVAAAAQTGAQTVLPAPMSPPAASASAPPLADPPAGLRARRPVERTRISLPEGGEGEVWIDAAESPLAWLRRRKGRDGAPLIGEAAFQAGERLRADLTRAGTLPGVTMDWSRPYADAGAAGPRGLLPAEAGLAARQRVTAALVAVGPDFAGLLVDLCGFLTPLAEIERARGWPARSGKVLIRLALERLAAHYGIAGAARGPERSRGLRQWGAPDYRPRIDAQP